MHPAPKCKFWDVIHEIFSVPGARSKATVKGGEAPMSQENGSDGYGTASQGQEKWQRRTKAQVVEEARISVINSKQATGELFPCTARCPLTNRFCTYPAFRRLVPLTYNLTSNIPQASASKALSHICKPRPMPMTSNIIYYAQAQDA